MWLKATEGIANDWEMLMRNRGKQIEENKMAIQREARIKLEFIKIINGSKMLSNGKQM